jgi:hypothetical protein
MFVVYEISTYTFPVRPLPDVRCPKCQQANALKIIFQKDYMGLPLLGPGMPLFLTLRTASLDCTSCHQPVSLADETDEIKEAIKKLMKRTYSPLKQYRALLILLSVFVSILIAGKISTYGAQKEKENFEALRNNPVVGDKYYVLLLKNNKLDNTVFKLTRIDGDTLWMLKNKANKEGNCYEDKFWDSFSLSENSFEAEQIAYSKSKLLKDVQLQTFADLNNRSSSYQRSGLSGNVIKITR